MKRILALILAALLLMPTLTSCGKTEPDETTSNVETNSPEADPVATDALATDPVETNAPAVPPTFPTDRITENGQAMAKIVVSPSASQLEKQGAEELRYHIEKVSGAAVELAEECPTDCLSLIIATPYSLPELNELFPEDISWLTTLSEDGRNYADDGFAIRQIDGKVYIFGATPRGTLNGVYDFIEKNLGVLWVRAYEEVGLVYEEMPTITLVKTGYREKSPFQIRGWTAGGVGEEPGDMITQTMFTRNKLNTAYTAPYTELHYTYKPYSDLGMTPFLTSENIKWWVKNSPLYDPNNPEFWNTDANGQPMTADTSPQANYLSDLTSDAVAASVIALLDQFTPTVKLKYVGVCVADTYNLPWLHEKEDFEYAPGQIVTPGEKEYLSTIFFTFLNKVARQVKEKYPDVTILTYAYDFAIQAPKCDLEDNILAVFCPVEEDMTDPLTDTTNVRNATIYTMIEDWKAKTNQVVFYNYYGCFSASTRYSRPCWDRIQADMQYYAESGLMGVMSEGSNDGEGRRGNIWATNALTFWLYGKLSWNPYADVDALIKEFCDKCYGDASPYMQEYYSLLEGCWHLGKESEVQTPTMRVEIPWATPLETYIESFIDNYDLQDQYGDVPERLMTALNNAWEAADDLEKERILRLKENMEYILYYIENMEFPD